MHIFHWNSYLNLLDDELKTRSFRGYVMPIFVMIGIMMIGIAINIEEASAYFGDEETTEVAAIDTDDGGYNYSEREEDEIFNEEEAARFVADDNYDDGYNDESTPDGAQQNPVRKKKVKNNSNENTQEEATPKKKKKKKKKKKNLQDSTQQDGDFQEAQENRYQASDYSEPEPRREDYSRDNSNFSGRLVLDLSGVNFGKISSVSNLNNTYNSSRNYFNERDGRQADYSGYEKGYGAFDQNGDMSYSSFYPNYSDSGSSSSSGLSLDFSGVNFKPTLPDQVGEYNSLLDGIDYSSENGMIYGTDNNLENLGILNQDTAIQPELLMPDQSEISSDSTEDSSPQITVPIDTPENAVLQMMSDGTQTYVWPDGTRIKTLEDGTVVPDTQTANSVTVPSNLSILSSQTLETPQQTSAIPMQLPAISTQIPAVPGTTGLQDTLGTEEVVMEIKIPIDIPAGTTIGIGDSDDFLFTLPDGMKVQVFQDGTKIIENSDGTKLKILADGTVIQIMPDGSEITMAEGGSETTDSALQNTTPLPEIAPIELPQTELPTLTPTGTEAISALPMGGDLASTLQTPQIPDMVATTMPNAMPGVDPSQQQNGGLNNNGQGNGTAMSGEEYQQVVDRITGEVISYFKELGILDDEVIANLGKGMISGTCICCKQRAFVFVINTLKNRGMCQSCLTKMMAADPRSLFGGTLATNSSYPYGTGAYSNGVQQGLQQGLQQGISPVVTGNGVLANGANGVVGSYGVNNGLAAGGVYGVYNSTGYDNAGGYGANALPSPGFDANGNPVAGALNALGSEVGGVGGKLIGALGSLVGNAFSKNDDNGNSAALQANQYGYVIDPVTGQMVPVAGGIAASGGQMVLNAAGQLVQLSFMANDPNAPYGYVKDPVTGQMVPATSLEQGLAAGNQAAAAVGATAATGVAGTAATTASGEQMVLNAAGQLVPLSSMAADPNAPYGYVKDPVTGQMVPATSLEQGLAAGNQAAAEAQAAANGTTAAGDSANATAADGAGAGAATSEAGGNAAETSAATTAATDSATAAASSAESAAGTTDASAGQTSGEDGTTDAQDSAELKEVESQQGILQSAEAKVGEVLSLVEGFKNGGVTPDNLQQAANLLSSINGTVGNKFSEITEKLAPLQSAVQQLQSTGIFTPENIQNVLGIASNIGSSIGSKFSFLKTSLSQKVTQIKERSAAKKVEKQAQKEAKEAEKQRKAEEKQKKAEASKKAKEDRKAKKQAAKEKEAAEKEANKKVKKEKQDDEDTTSSSTKKKKKTKS